MQNMHITPLTEEDRRRNEYLDKVNHAPYFEITLGILAVFTLFTCAVLLGIF